MGEQVVFNELAMKLANSVGQQLTQLIPGVQAVCITLVGESLDIPLGGIICHPDHLDSDTLIRAIARLSDQIDVLTRKLLGKDGNGVDTDGQDSPSLGEKGPAECVPDSGDGPPDQEDQGKDEAPAGDAG